MHVVETGAEIEDARPLLLLHGWSCHGGFFAPQLEAFGHRARLIVPDLPGHGRTGATGPALTIEAAADAVAALLAGRSLDGVTVVGWSMGAHVAYSMIERHGTARLSGLVVIDMTPRVLNDRQWQLGLSDGLDALRNRGVLKSIEGHWPEIAPRIARRIFAGDLPVDPALAGYTEREIAAADPALLAPMWASLTRQDFRGLLPRIDLPVIIAHGSRSMLYGADVARWQVEQLPDGQIFEFVRSGHAPHLEEPDSFNEMLGEILA
ncbi:alpha/beta hydrolase [Microbaculum marinum]|uniref:Alpha/beta hydrolase n=1 Tax=Microbaculum marinum TaxID=1764581 RepID=A0AAW9RYS4_9HYPH